MTTELLREAGDWPSEPLAPASVWTLDAEPALLIELQRLLALSGRSATFETYGYSPAVLSPGGHYSLISWWNPTQLSVATDVDLDWRLREYEGSDHDHCLLTWETILPGRPAYMSDAGWITVGAYARIVRDDVLRIRRA